MYLNISEEFWKSKKIDTLSLIVTQECNLNCFYCYVDKKKIDMTNSVLNAGIEFLFKTKGDNKRIAFVGGEPSMKIDLVAKGIDLAKHFGRYYNKKIETIINTNGTILNQKILNIYQQADFISISIDGNKDSFNFRSGPNNEDFFYKVLKNFNLIKKAFPEKIIINKVISSNNYKNLIEDASFIFSLEPNRVFFNIAAGDQGWDNKKVEDFFEKIRELTEWMSQHSKKRIIRKTFQSFFEENEPECSLASLAVSPNGDIYHCEFLANLKQDLLGNVKKEVFRKDFLSCEFDPQKRRCREALCRQCEQACLSANFSYKHSNKKTSLLSISCLKRARGFYSFFTQKDI